MTASILSILLLVSPASLPSSLPSGLPSGLPSSQPPSLVEPESGAWAVVHAGELWVCWSPGSDCFERVVFDDAPPEAEDVLDEDSVVEDFDLEDELEEPEAVDLGVGTWLIGFAGPRSLWVEHGEQRFRILRGQRRARLVDEQAPVRLGRIGPVECGPHGMVPALIGGTLSFREAPRCVVEVSAQACVSRAGPRTRKPTPVRLRAGLELVNSRASKAKGPELAIVKHRHKVDLDIKVFVELGFDWQRRAAHQRARALVTRRSEARLRGLPAVTPGPLAQAEEEALAAVVCDGGLR